MTDYLHVVFDGVPGDEGPRGPRFVEVEAPDGSGVGGLPWVRRPDGLTYLRVAAPNAVAALRAQVASLTAERDALKAEKFDALSAALVREGLAMRELADTKAVLDEARATLKAVREAVATMDEPIPAEPTHYMTRGLTAEPRPEFMAWERRTQAAQRRLRELLAPAPKQPERFTGEARRG